MMAFIGEGLIFWAFVFMREYQVISRISDGVACLFGLCKKGKEGLENYGFNGDPYQIEDSDVLEEKSKVSAMNKRDATVIVKDVKKWYGRNNAVKGVNFHLDVGDCFGLLGKPI